MSDTHLSRRLIAVPLFLSAASLLLALPAPLRIACGFAQAFCLPGYVALRYLGDRARHRLDTLFLTLLLSPIVLTLLILGVHLFTGSFDAALRISLILLYALLFISLFLRGTGEPAKDLRLPTRIVAVSAIFCGIIIVTYAANDYLFAFDTVRHSSIANEILYRGMPPLEPFFPDMPIQSNWIAYIFMAAWKSLSGLTMVHAMWLFNCVGICIFPVLVARIASFFTDRLAYILAAPFFALASLGSVSWIFFPLRFAAAFVGEVRGQAELARILEQMKMNGIYVVQYLNPLGTFAVNVIEKFLVIDVQHYALNLFLLCVIVALGDRFHKRPSARATLIFFIAMMGSFLFHIFTGVYLIGAVIISGFVALFERTIRKRRPPLFRSVIVPCCGVAAAVIGLRFFASFRGVYADGVFVPDRASFNVRNLLTIVVPLVILIPFSLRALRDIFAGEDGQHRLFRAWLVSFALVAVTMDLRGTLESMAVYPLFLLLVVPITLKIVDALRNAVGRRRMLLSLWIAVLFLVPAVLTVRGHMLEKPEIAHHVRRHRITDDERRIYEWIRENTAIDAVIIERNEYNVMSYYAGRRNFYMTSWEITNYGYRGEKVERYKRIRDELYSDEPISPETARTLASFAFDLYLVVWREDREADPALATRFDSYPELFRIVYENPAGMVYVFEQR